MINLLSNKKVLLCERKRHTARRVASARYAAPSPNGGRGGVPHPVPDGGRGEGYPIQSQMGGTPFPSAGGCPHLDLGRGTEHPTPHPAPCLDLGRGYPPAPLDLGRDTPHLDLGKGYPCPPTPPPRR